jgi:glycosyltransferase involved in cell wall biosynthesis
MPAVLLLDVTAGEAAACRRHARQQYPAVPIHTVDDLLTEIAPDEALPLTAFRFPWYWRSYRIALAVRRLCRQTRLAGIELADFNGPAYVTLKWRRMWGDELSEVPIWLRLHATSELVLAADGALNDSREQQQLFAMERYALTHADGWISPSASVAEWYRCQYDCPAVPVVIAAPPLPQIGSGNRHPRVLGDPPYRILFYGKLQRVKGADLLVKAAVSLWENHDLPVTLEMVGSDTSHGPGRSYQKELERLIPPQWRDRVHFHGHIPPERLEEIACRCSLAVVPSRVETFCLAAHELNWIGIPLILNDLPALKDYFADGTDCRIFAGTCDSLASVLREVIGQPSPFATWKWNAPEIVVAERTCEAYSEALSRFHPRSSAPCAEPAPLVSVVIPYYNMQQYVDAALASVRASDYGNWEIVLVDDGSSDQDAEVKFEALFQEHQGDARYRFLQKPNGGLSSARNYGIRHARGQYVLPLDSDDVLDPRYLGRAVAALSRLPEVAAVSCFAAYFADGKSPEQPVDYIIPYDLHPLLILLENRAGVACSMFRREVFDRFRYNEELDAYEDWDLWWQMAEAGVRAETMPMLLFRYRRRPDSMVRTVGAARGGQILASFADRHADYLRQHGDWAFRASLRRMRELERLVRLFQKYSLSFRLAEIALRWYHAVRARPNCVPNRLLQQLCRRSDRIRRLCVRLEQIVP